MRECDDGTTRADHLKWCKERALAYLDRGDADEAFNSMCSDMNKHTETADHIGLGLGLRLKMLPSGMGIDATRKWITGFN